ncbi:MAG TPA: hypothetical protein VE978_10215 [Chitinophagales bacterium]|nr:hypothetical protein [Chitinophagales bacterium]
MTILKLYFTLFAAFTMQSILSAQPVIPNVLVDASASNAECTIVINPKNPDYLMASTLPSIIYRSTDGGLTWTEDLISDFSIHPIVWDVVLAADTSGHFFCQGMDQNSLFRTLRSDDYGLTWGNETVFGDIGCTEDKSWMTVDKSPLSPYIGNIYSTWTLRHGSGCNTAGYFFVNHSDDAGQSWSARDTLDSDPSFVPPIGGGMSVGPSGEIGITWSGGLPNQIHFKKSTDGGNTWTASPIIVDNSVLPANDYAAFIEHSVGATSQFTSLSYDISGGPYNGNLYCVWDDLRNGPENADIFLARSIDGGQTWETQRINDDTTTRNQILPTVAVDPSSGWVYVSYLDARLNKDNFDDTLNYYLAWSGDGGQTFQNIQVSQQPSTLTWLHSDYMGMDAYGGKVHLLWVGGNSATGQQTWTACATQSLLTVVPEANALSEMLVYPAFPNPAIDFTTLDFRLSQPMSVSLKITDLKGCVVAKPFDEKKYQVGRHQVCLDHHVLKLLPGIYIAILSTPSGAFSRKFEVFH